MDIQFVYITVRSPEEAKKIAVDLVETQLAACANIIPGMQSVYRWKGEIAQDTETVLILKTSSPSLKALTARVKELHSYECPCVAVWSIENGYEPYLDWIRENSQGTAGGAE